MALQGHKSDKSQIFEKKERAAIFGGNIDVFAFYIGNCSFTCLNILLILVISVKFILIISIPSKVN